jgi:hypothetical protein
LEMEFSHTLFSPEARVFSFSGHANALEGTVLRLRVARAHDT